MTQASPYATIRGATFTNKTELSANKIQQHTGTGFESIIDLVIQASQETQASKEMILGPRSQEISNLVFIILKA